MVEKVDTLAGFEKLRGPWSDLLVASSADCFFLTWEWLYTWWKHLAGGRALYILTIESDGRLIGIAPLAMRPRRVSDFPARPLEFLGSGIAGSDYLDLILRRGKEAEAIGSLAEYLANRKLQLAMGQLREPAAAWRLAWTLEDRDGYRAFQMETDRCPYIDLTGQTWQTYLGALGASHRAQRGSGCLDRSASQALARAWHVRGLQQRGDDRLSRRRFTRRVGTELAAPLRAAAERPAGGGALRLLPRRSLLFFSIRPRPGVLPLQRRACNDGTRDQRRPRRGRPRIRSAARRRKL